MEHSSQFPDSFFRVTIKGVYVKDGKVLLMRNSLEKGGKWTLPGGGLEFGESFEVGFKREIDEEMGLKVLKMSEQPIYVWTQKYEKNRDLEWFYALAVAYRVTFADLDFTKTIDCEEVRFFTKEELKDLPLKTIAHKFLELFNPADFTDPF